MPFIFQQCKLIFVVLSEYNSECFLFAVDNKVVEVVTSLVTILQEEALTGSSIVAELTAPASKNT